MKHTRMIALGGFLAVLLMAAVFAGAAAGDEDLSEKVTFNVNTSQELDIAENAYKIWQNVSANTGKNKYWIDLKDGKDVNIPINATSGNSTNPYLVGYNVSFDGTLKTPFTAAGEGTYWKLNNITLGSSYSGIVNTTNWHIAKAIDDGTATAVNGTDILNITIYNAAKTGKNLTDGNDYAIGVLLSNLALTSKPTVGEIDNIDLIKFAYGQNGSTFTTSDKKFNLHALNSSRVLIYNFTDYIEDVVGSTNDVKDKTIYLYSEHDNGIVEMNLTLDDKYYNTYNTEQLTVDKTNAFVSNSTADYSKDKKLIYTLGLKTDKKSPVGGELKVVLNEFASAPTKNISGYKYVNISQWNPYKSDNNNTPTQGRGGSNWNFDNNLTVNFTVYAGTVDYSDDNYDGRNWDSYVPFGTISVPGNATASWTPQTVKYLENGTTTSVTSGSYVVNNLQEGKKIATGALGGKNLTVTNNSINDGKQKIDIQFVGYRAGDANLNNEVNIVDSAAIGVAVLKEFNGQTKYWSDADFRMYLKDDPTALLYMDCNQQAGDGTIDVADILAVNKYLVEMNPWAA